mgnify:CR=1 FL=1|tara:strand:+ start:22 stop:324 length:303 start_codon:yes stop_codon:yes gene_type:complete
METFLINRKRITIKDSAKTSVLGDIKVYCVGEQILLINMFEKIYAFESGSPYRMIPMSTTTDLECYFFEILDNYVEDLVYPSDIKKILQWYNLLLSKKID